MYTDKELPDYMSANVKRRYKIERRIVKSLVRELLGHGFELSVHDGEERHPRTTDAGTLFSQLMNTDMDTLFAYPATSDDPYGVVLVYGNDGYDVMCDWSVDLEDNGYITETIALAESLED
ncbi:hypothetical protein BH762_gp023 [Gordonia phage OneUp]|uniref:Uncharacterized protein n=1 Tax=Gordonia phage OneUp TaxID=1838074 RepID=A0A160DF28_9CAUD|nr:hypothetical protein BH762_gp023 [Gordonia phage OneUp]ANA86495.1 hypothetical protein PBI_ONEUP_162 [Gordonia phage OneUp]